MRSGSRAVVRLWLGHALVLAALAAVALVPLSSARIVPLALVLACAGIGWWVSLAAAARCPPSDRAAGPMAIALGALALRLVALTGAAELSDDPYRYVWEGALVLEGQSPYAHAPDDPELAALRARWPALHARVSHREVSAAYPPLAELVCAAVVGLAGGPGAGDASTARAALRAAFGLCDLLLLVPLFRLLALAGRPPALASAWAFSPLVAMEFAGTGHLDVLGILLLVAALASARAPLAGALLAAGALVKLLPLVALPFRARAAPARARGLAPGALVLALGLCVPFLWRGGGLGLERGLSDYALRWESFSLLYRWIERPLRACLEPDGGWSDPRRVGRCLMALAWLASALWVWRRAPQAGHAARAEPRIAVARSVFLVLGAFLMLTPTLHPWYLTWIVPFLALFPARAWTWLVAAAPLAYWPLERWRREGVWVEPAWLWPLLALPFWALVLLDRRRAARGVPSP